MKKLEGKRAHRLCGRDSWGAAFILRAFYSSHTNTYMYMSMCARGRVYRHSLHCLKHINRISSSLPLNSFFVETSYHPMKSEYHKTILIFKLTV